MRVFRTSLFLLLNLFSWLCATLFFLPRTWTTHNSVKPYEIDTVVIVRYYDQLSTLAFLSAFLLLVLAFASLKVKTIPFRLAIWILPLVLYPAGCARATFANLGEWNAFRTSTDTYGNSYYFLESSFLQGKLLSIGRLKAQSLFVDEYEVFATTNGDSPRRYLNIVRPRNVDPSRGYVIAANDKWVVGLPDENKMYLAYNRISKTAYVGKDIYSLSPFLLIDEDTAMNEDDVQQIMRIGIGSGVGQPRLKPIFADFNNHNSAVTSLAQILVANIPNADQELVVE